MNDGEVQSLLSSLGQPSILEDETPESRADRLRGFLDSSNSPGASPHLSTPTPSSFSLLLQSRHKIASDSLIRAQSRLFLERSSAPPKSLSYSAVGSMFCDNRLPMSVSIDSSSTDIAIGGWSGDCTLWTAQGKLISTFQGHSDKVQCVSLFRHTLLSGSFDATVRLWADSPQIYRGHLGRVNSVKWHPSLPYIFSASHDMTWKMWDTETAACVLTQEGHNRGVYALDVHPDGGLVATGDLAGVGAVWDLRTGKNILVLKGHIKQILACCFSDNGYLIGTGSDDCTVKIWDMRRKGMLYSIPAHSKLISAIDIRGDTLASVSYDGFAKVWSLADFSLVQSINHEAKITDVSLNGDAGVMVTTCFDRTFKIWERGCV